MNGPLSLNAWLFAAAAIGLVALLVFAYARRGAKSGLGRRALTVAALALGPAVAALCLDWGLDRTLENPEPQASAVMAMAVSPDGANVATADVFGRTRIYDLSRGSYVAGPSFAGATPRVGALHMLKGAAGKDLLVAISDQSSFATAGMDGRQSEPAIDDARPYLMSLAVGNGLFVVEKWTAPANAQQSVPGNEFDVKYIDFRDARPRPISHVMARPTAMAIVMPVTRLQAALVAFSKNGMPVDGIVGPMTIDAITRFQRQNGLGVTGSVDTATIGKILELNLADIGSLQILLGFADGRIAVADQLLQGPITRFSLDASNFSKDPQATAPPQRPILRIAGNGAGRVVTTDADGHLSLWGIDPKSSQPAKDVNFEAATEIVLTGHTNDIWDANFSPNGALIVTASADKTARLWDAPSGNLLATLSGHTGAVNAASFSPDGSRVATASSDGTARLWDTASGRPLATFSGHTDVVNHAAFSPDGTRILTASQDGTARLWDVATGRQIAALTGHRRAVWTATFSPDGSRIVTASSDGTARLWDGATGSNLATLMGHGGQVTAASFSPDGARIVTVSDDSTARLWNGSTGAELAILSGHSDIVNVAAFSPDGARVATGSNDQTARLWDATSGRLLTTLSGHTKSIRGLAFSPDGARLVTASDDTTLRIWNGANGDRIAVVQTRGWAFNVAFSPDGRFIVAAAVADVAPVWDASTGLPIKTAPCIGCLSLRFNMIGGSTIEATDYTGRTRRFDAATGKQSGEGEAWAQGHVVALDDGRYLDSRADGSVFVYDPVAGKKTELVAHTAMIASAEALPDGRIATASIDGTIHIVDPAMQSYLAAVDPWPALQSGANAFGAGLQSLYGSVDEMAASLRQRFAPALGGITPPASDAPPAADVTPPAGVSPPATAN